MDPKPSSVVEHDSRRLLRPQDERTTCFGVLRRTGVRCKSEGKMQKYGYLPTCKIHAAQFKPAARCRFRQKDCGLACHKLLEWKPHGFRLCPEHRHYATKCYFLDLPNEVRLMIYGYLLPSGPVSALKRYGAMREDGSRPQLAIMATNRMIHDEVAYLLYSCTDFVIDFSGDTLEMCASYWNPKANPKDEWDRRPVRRYYMVTSGMAGMSNGALQDYQMQLMLLEQQNKKRLFIARQEQAGIRASRNSFPQDQLNDDRILTSRKGPVWTPWLSQRYFEMIRSFRVDIWFYGKLMHPAPRPRLPAPPSDEDKEWMQTKLYYYCDQLHALVERLARHPVRIRDLSIAVRCIDAYMVPTDVALAARMLLRPFRRLRRIETPRLQSLSFHQSSREMVELIDKLDQLDPSEAPLVQFLEAWKRDMSSAQPPPPSAVCQTYWQVEQLLMAMRGHRGWYEPRPSAVEDILATAKVAREADDITVMHATLNQAVNMWSFYLEEQSLFEEQIRETMRSIPMLAMPHPTITLPPGLHLVESPSPYIGKGKQPVRGGEEPADTTQTALFRDDEGTEYFESSDGFQKRLLTPMSGLRRA